MQIEIELSKIEGILKENALKTLPYYLDFEADYSFKTLKNISGVLLSLTEAKIRAKMLITNKVIHEFKESRIACFIH